MVYKGDCKAEEDCQLGRRGSWLRCSDKVAKKRRVC